VAQQITPNSAFALSVLAKCFAKTFDNCFKKFCFSIQDPNYLKRVWCIFEIHAAQHNNCDITIEMPRKEREDFKKTILKDFDNFEEMLKTLSDISIDKANTSVPEDKDNILKVVKAGVGVNSLNVSVAKMMRTWFFTQLNEFIKELDVDVEKENYGGKDLLELTIGYESLGYIFDSNGDFKTAMDCYTKQIKLSEKCFGEDHPETAASYNDIAVVLTNLGQYEEVIQYHKKSIAINKKVYGFDHPNTARSYKNIGLVYSKKKELDTALYYFEKCRRIRENVYGKVHERTAQVYHSIGSIHYEKGDYDLAMQYYEDSLKIKKETIGADHPNTATSYKSIGLIHKDKEDWDKALEFYFLALHIYEKVLLGEEHPDTISTYKEIFIAYFKKGDQANARKYYKKSQTAGRVKNQRSISKFKSPHRNKLHKNQFIVIILRIIFCILLLVQYVLSKLTHLK
jgi:tetratricopeptide (TPR) repeat protein